MNTATLIQMLPARARAIIYGLISTIGLGLGACQTGYASAHIDQPVWLIVAWSVYGFVAAGVGMLAAGNVTPTPAEPDADGEDLMDYTDEPEILTP